MKAPKHTPGPYREVAGDIIAGIDLVATVAVKNAKANANLIVEAPDLLLTAQKFLAMFGDQLHEKDAEDVARLIHRAGGVVPPVRFNPDTDVVLTLQQAYERLTK